MKCRKVFYMLLILLSFTFLGLRMNMNVFATNTTTTAATTATSTETKESESSGGKVESESKSIVIPEDLKGGIVNESKEKLIGFLINDEKTGLFNIASYMGIVVLAISIFKYIIAFKAEDADSKLQATYMMMGALFFIVLPSLINTLKLGILK